MRSGCRKGTTGLETSLGKHQLVEVEGAWGAEAGLSQAVPGTPSAPAPSLLHGSFVGPVRSKVVSPTPPPLSPHRDL